MIENLPGSSAPTESGNRLPDRGPITENDARIQIRNYLPDLFTNENNISFGLDHADKFWAGNVTERQIRYSCGDFILGEKQYGLTELVINHLRLTQTHIESMLHERNWITDSLQVKKSDIEAWAETKYKYCGWYVEIRMGADSYRDPLKRILKFKWEGQNEYGYSDTVSVSFTDIDGNGPKMVVDPEGVLNFPRLKQTLNLTQTELLKNIQSDSDFRFYNVRINRIKNLFGFSYITVVGSHQETESLVLPLQIRAIYP